jgi:epoxyqueuosine reductase
MKVLSAEAVRDAARGCGFALVGLARAEPLDPRPLQDWLARGCAADLAAMQRRQDERLDPRVVVRNAQTVLVLGIPYGRGEASDSPAIARYARGRDYHYAHRDRMKRLRQRLLALDATLYSYACVDSGAAMEKAWGERAGLGFIGKNGMLISRRHGSYFTLSLMVLNRAVDDYDRPARRRCGDCRACLDACPTEAFPSPGVVDCRRCLAYHTVENHAEIPGELWRRIGERVFGCDICQEVCPYNRGDLLPGDPRQVPRPLGRMSAMEIAALDAATFEALAAGTPMKRIGYHGLRRNACLVLGARRDWQSRDLLARLADDASSLVAAAARWALGELGVR